MGAVRPAAATGSRLRAVSRSRATRTRSKLADARQALRAARLAGAAARSGALRPPRALVKRALELAETLVPSERYYELFIRSHAPDVVLITPLIDFGSYQTDYVKSAHRLGIPVAFLPFSWDNLTNRGLVRIAPDRVLVWNEHQKREAVDVSRRPGRSHRRDGCAAVRRFLRDAAVDDAGRVLRARRARSVAAVSAVPVLVAFRRAGRSRIRARVGAARCARDPSVGDCGILVRPHPANAEPWEGVDLAAISRTRPCGPSRRRCKPIPALYDSLYHCARPSPD